MPKKAIGADRRARVVDDAIAGPESGERSQIKRKSDVQRAAARVRLRALLAPPTNDCAPEEPTYRPVVARKARVRPAKRRRHSTGERIGRRLPWMSLAYAAVAAFGVGSGLHPMAPAIVVAVASASSAGLVAMMASHRMVSAPYAVAFAAITASTHAWAQACVAPDGASGASFALTALGGMILFDRPSHLAGYLSAVGGGFAVALGACAIREPIGAWAELVVASTAAIAVTGIRAARRAA